VLSCSGEAFTGWAQSRGLAGGYTGEGVGRGGGRACGPGQGRGIEEFESFVAEASDPLRRAGYLMTGDVTDAEDLVQETLLRVARQW
jgi:hypothetical protein